VPNKQAIFSLSERNVRQTTKDNIGYMTLTGSCDWCGAFSHDR